MKFCIKCGKPIEEGERFCRACGNPIPASGSAPNPGNTSGNANAGTTQNSQPKPQNENNGNSNEYKCPVILTDGEVVMRKYEVTRDLIFPIRGHLTVTNKRLILHGKGIFSELLQETPINDVGTIHQSAGMTFKPWAAVVGLILLFNSGAFGRLFEYILDKNFTFLFVLIALCILFFAVKPSNLLTIMTGKASGKGIDCGDKNTSGIAFTILGSRKGADYNIMMRELGAMVSDFQTLGDVAISKWINKF